MSLGIFAVNEKEEIRIIEKESVRYARMDNENPLWYPKGQLQFNDLIINITGGEKPEIIISCRNNDDIIPLAKNFESRNFLFETVFYEKYVKWKGYDDGFSITVNAQTLEYTWEIRDVLIVCRRENIIYFSPGNKKNDENKEKILGGEQYSAFLDDRKPIILDKFFCHSVALAVRSLSEEKPVAYSGVYNNKVCIALVDSGRIIPGTRLVSIGDEDDYYKMVRCCTQSYNKLYYENEMKLYENQLDNKARLKGFGENILEINKKLERVCQKNVTIVLTGESGTGKTYIARQIHENSRRKNSPFVSVNCAAIAPNLIESELFGYEDGAFTGAKKGGKQGYFEMANGGTLFLDEISELPLLLQGKLLEVLQEGTFYRVGGTKKISVDIRLIVATNRNLEKMVRDELFREDLYYRINVFPINLPPLRDRIDDMYSIIDDTLPDICRRLDIEVPIIEQDAMEEMQKYSWPGNIRELENILEKAAVMSENNIIKKEDIIIDNRTQKGLAAQTLKEKLSEYEKILITDAYERFKGNRREISDYLGISKTNLFEKIHKYGLDEEGGKR